MDDDFSRAKLGKIRRLPKKHLNVACLWLPIGTLGGVILQVKHTHTHKSSTCSRDAKCLHVQPDGVPFVSKRRKTLWQNGFVWQNAFVQSGSPWFGGSVKTNRPNRQASGAGRETEGVGRTEAEGGAARAWRGRSWSFCSTRSRELMILAAY